MIRAKPQDRRQILEEASGTIGLAARRHEAELKLKAAEHNLTRVDDVLKAYDTQLRSLKTQVRQASRYRNLAEHIRRTEAALLHLRWVETEQNTESLRTALATAEQSAVELLALVTQHTASRTEIASELPSLRQTEAVAAAIVQKLTLTREQIETETKRIAAETEAHEQRLSQARSDHEREQTRRADGEAAITKLQDEDKELSATAATIAEHLPNTTQTLTDLTQEVETLDAALTQLVQTVAESEARKKSLQQETENLKTQCANLRLRREQLDLQRVALAAEVAGRPDLSFAVAMVNASETELAKRQQQAQTAEQTYREAEMAQTAAHDAVREKQSIVTKLKAEAEAIDTMLQQQNDGAQQVIDLIAVTPGLESALAVALGEALTAALDTDAAMHWRQLLPLAQLPILPEGIAPLAQYIEAPAALERCLSQVGFTENQAVGEAAAALLLPGQIIVSRDGWAWRWDGFTVTPQAKTATAIRLQQRNRLAALKAEMAQAETAAQDAEKTLAEAASIFTQQQAEDRQARDALKAAFAALNDARETYSKEEKESTAVTTKLAALDDSLRQLTSDIEQLRARASDAESEYGALPDIEAQREVINEQRTQLTERRDNRASTQNELDRLTREQTMCETRRASVKLDITAWQARLDNASQQIDALTERMTVIEGQLDKIKARPAELAAAHAQLLTELTDAEARRREAADTLIQTEQRLQGVESELKQSEAALSAAREERVRCEGAIAAAAEHFNMLRERMTEKLNCGPEDLAAIAATGENPEGLAELEQTLTRYVRERDNMGPVNLRAEVEAETTQGQIDTLQTEKDDLVNAIAKLRQGISTLNREARERLQKHLRWSMNVSRNCLAACSKAARRIWN